MGEREFDPSEAKDVSAAVLLLSLGATPALVSCWWGKRGAELTDETPWGSLTTTKTLKNNSIYR